MFGSALDDLVSDGTITASQKTAVSEALSRNFLDIDVETGVGNGRLLAYLAAHGEVLSKQFSETRVIIHCRIPQKHLPNINDDQTIIRPHLNGAARMEDVA